LNLSEKKEVVIKAGHRFTLNVPFQGDPAPQIEWSRADEVCQNNLSDKN
jgi:hypothetical protein